MTCEQLVQAVDFLKHLDAENETAGDILGRMFSTCLQLFELIEESDLASSSEEYQDSVKKCIKYLEKCTVMVNELDLFSSNESINEIQTCSIRYLVLPALLGSLNLLVQNKKMSERLENLLKAEVYFKDFLLRCQNYELIQDKMQADFDEVFPEDDNAVSKRSSGVPTTADLVSVREKKIYRYKLKQSLKHKEKELKYALNRPELEEQIRTCYTAFVQKWIITSLEELENIKREKSVIESMVHKGESFQNNTQEKKFSSVQKFKPIIITRNEMQKKVFGMGYPSLPVMTIDDFYRQRFEKYNQDQMISGKSLQEKVMTGHFNEKEKEEIEKEELLEKDDSLTLKKAREWDDWKDDNPRGSGNRKNKG